MDNPTSIWRGRAKIVAIVELFLSTLGFFMLVLVVALSINLTAASNEIVDEETTQVLPDENGLDLNVVEPGHRRWIANAARVVLTAVQFFAAITLFKSTKPECSGPDATRMAKIWIAINVVLIALGVLSEIVNGGSGLIIFFVIRWIIRGVEIFIVYRFLGELKGTMSSLDGIEDLDV